MCSVRIELHELSLHSLQGVLKLPFIQDLYDVFYPLEQVRGQRLVLVDHAVVLQHVVQYLRQEKTTTNYNREQITIN